MDDKQRLQITDVKISNLKAAIYNPRKWSASAISSLKDSIKIFGIVDPIIVNAASARKNIVIGGHMRLQAAISLGIKEVPVVYLNIPNIAKEKELNLRLNRNQGEWDFKLLAEFDEALLKQIGFESAELDRIFEVAVEEDKYDAAKEYAKIKKPKARRGDVYQLGAHRLMCGDSTSAKDFAALMQGALARLIFTDPPYNVDYKSPSGMSYNSQKFGGTGGKIFNDNKSDADCLDFYVQVLKNLSSFSAKDVTLYWWFANRNNHINRQAFEFAGWHLSQIIIWLKNSPVLSRGQDYHRCYEPCMMGWKEKGKHFSVRKIANLKDVFHLDVADFSEMLDVWYEHRDVTNEYVHPTQKPVRLPERALKKNSERGDIVLDAFGGSGSTLIACEQLSRRCFAMELDAKYVDVIIKRWEQFTGKKAALINKKNCEDTGKKVA